MSKVRKIICFINKKIIAFHNLYNVKKYMKKYISFLQKCGINIPDYKGTGYIDPSVYFDSSDYRLFTLGNNVTISKEVMMLTHDYSIWNGMISIDIQNEHKRFKFSKPISIGDNCFIGARSFILPGTNIGDNVIIGAGSVVKGTVPSGTVWCGNPAKCIMSTAEFTHKHITKQDFMEINE